MTTIELATELNTAKENCTKPLAQRFRLNLPKWRSLLRAVEGMKKDGPPPAELPEEVRTQFVRLSVAKRSVPAVISKGLDGWYRWAGSPGTPLAFWEVQALELIGQGKAADPDSMLRRQANEVLRDPPSRRVWRMTQEEATSALLLLDGALPGAMHPISLEEAHERWTMNVNCIIEAQRLHAPGKVFKTADFKGGAIDPLTWVYVLRAHFRKVPRLHLRCTLDEQAVMLEAALREAPTLFAGLLDATEP